MMDVNEARRADMEEAKNDYNFDLAVKAALRNYFKHAYIFRIIEGKDLVITEDGTYHYEFDGDGKLGLHYVNIEEEPFATIDMEIKRATVKEMEQRVMDMRKEAECLHENILYQADNVRDQQIILDDYQNSLSNLHHELLLLEKEVEAHYDASDY